MKHWMVVSVANRDVWFQLDSRIFQKFEVMHIAKALKISNKTNIYGYYSSQIIDNNYNILIKLLKEGRLTKNFIQPKYSK